MGAAAAVAIDTDTVGTLENEWLEHVRFYMDVISDHSFADTPVGEVLQDTVSTPGKMIRPKLLLLCSAFGPFWKLKRDKLCMLAAMVELTHLASLIHDDIVDEAPLRRGVPSIQGKYGKDAAVYAGDFLMARINYFEAKEHLNEASEVLSRTIEQMCIGEIGQSRCRYREDVTTEQYLHNIQGKTTALFRAACQIGASESGCSTNVQHKLELLGENLGVMFQLRDDLLDFTADRASVGKETHKDFRNGIYTMPVLLALQDERGREKLLSIIRENAKRELLDDEIKDMEQTVIALGGTAMTARQINRLGEEIKELLRAFEEHPAARILKGIVEGLEVR